MKLLCTFYQLQNGHCKLILVVISWLRWFQLKWRTEFPIDILLVPFSILLQGWHNIKTLKKIPNPVGGTNRIQQRHRCVVNCLAWESNCIHPSMFLYVHTFVFNCWHVEVYRSLCREKGMWYCVKKNDLFFQISNCITW